MHYLMKVYCIIPVFYKIRISIQLEHKKIIRANQFKNHKMNNLIKILKKSKVKTLFM